MSEVTPRSIPVQMARASEADVDKVIEFLTVIEEYMEYGTVPLNADDCEEATPEEFVDCLRELWGERCGPAKVDAAWRRVVFGYVTLHDNCCDKASDVLELRADWKAVLERHEAAK